MAPIKRSTSESVRSSENVGYLTKFNQLLDRLQAANGAEPVFLGYISEFGLFPEEQRADFLQAHGDLVREAFFTPAGRLLMGYPGFPAAWMCAPFAADVEALGPDEISSKAKNIHSGKRKR
jgi:hypothetical protein